MGHENDPGVGMMPEIIAAGFLPEAARGPLSGVAGRRAFADFELFAYDSRRGYIVVRCNPGLPPRLARALNEVPSSEEGGYWSGERGTLGDVARANGHAGGALTTEINDTVHLWHVDSGAALQQLVTVLEHAVAAEGLTAESARADERRVFTRAVLDEIDRSARTSGVWHVLVRGLLSDERTDWSDERVTRIYLEARPQVQEWIRTSQRAPQRPVTG